MIFKELLTSPFLNPGRIGLKKWGFFGGTFMDAKNLRK